MIKNNYREEKGLYFHYMGGVGNITCKGCGYHKSLVSFIHSFPTDSWNQSGYPCQKCGKFHEIENDHRIKGDMKYECEGPLSREKVLFCPVCKSKDLKYHM